MKRLASRLMPAPLLSATLVVVWLVINQSGSLGQWLLGMALAVAIPWFTEPLRTERPVLRRPGLAMKLLARVLRDIVTSNLQVARLILGRESAIEPGFFWLPLSITDPHGIVALAGIITMTPGTLSADLSPDRRYLLIHAFNMDDEAALIESIKTQYEAPLMEIFK